MWISSAGWWRSATRSSQNDGPGLEPLADRVDDLPLRDLELAVGGRRPGEADVFAEVEGDAAVAAPEAPGADPDQLAAGAELVEPVRGVGAEPPRQHVGLPHFRRQRDALQRHQRLAQAVGAGARFAERVDVLPARQEAGELGPVGRLDLFAQAGERGAPHPAEHVGVAPLPLGPARQQLAADQRAFLLELAQRRPGVDAVALHQLPGRERAVGAGVAADQRAHRVGMVLEEGLRQPGRRRHAERVAVEPGVLGGDPALLAGDPHLGDPPLRGQLVEHRFRRVALVTRSVRLLGGQVADVAEQLLERVAVAGLARLGAVLELRFDFVERLRVDQFAQLLLAEQLAQQVAVERQRRRPPLGVRRVPLVHVGGDVVEEQRGGEGRGGRRFDLDQVERARVQLFQDLGEGREVEHVLQALAVGLEDHREAGEVPRDFEQALGLQPLLPERRALAGVGARDQQRARGVLAEAGAEQGRAGELADDQVFELVRVDQHEVGGRRLVGVGEVDDDAVVGPDRVGLEVALVADFPGQGEAPGGVDAAAVGGEDAEAPVADLVAEALDHDRLVGGDDPGRVLLFAQVGDEVVGGALVEVVLLRQLGGLAGDRLAGEGADRLAELGRAADPVAAPERHRAGGAGGGRDDHPVAGDFLDPPAARAEQEDLAGARLVDHLLVELADPPAVGQVDAVEAAVGDRAGVGDDQLARAFAAVDRPLEAVPDDPRAQLGEAVGG